MNEKDDVKGVDQILTNLSLLAPAIGKRIAVQLDITAKEVVNYARQNHPYTDRTTNLTQSIDQGDLLITEGRIEAEIVARQPYASFVEAASGGKFAYLWPAVARHQRVLVKRMVQAYKEGERVIRINEGLRGMDPT